MISKNKISDIRKLHLKKFRDAERLFLVEGRKSVEMLLLSDYDVMEIFATPEMADRNASMLAGRPVTEVSAAEMSRISTMSTAPELMAVARQVQDSEPIAADAPVIVLDRIADPGNLGTIVRTADWFDIRHVVCSPDSVEFYSPKTIQSTMGSFAHTHVHVADLPAFLREQGKSRRIIGTFLDGEPLQDFDFQPSDIIVMGSESHGISSEVANCVTHRVTIPAVAVGRATAESLNAAVAAAIVMHQLTLKTR
ncbi:MAG: RNA methyltransferase [Bacteroidales bacterium]|nr:RNA methyltransferase [Bacteroidales bacterium]